MNPAYSVIVFTTASGAGYGLLVGLAMAVLAQLVPLEPVLGVMGLGLALVLVTVGLLSSTLHLGRPERAWRALSQWRSSWLSREGVAAIATYVPALATAGLWVFAPQHSMFLLLTLLLTIVGALCTVWCTGMIYASLPTIRSWNQPLTAPCYLALSLLTGVVLLNLVLCSFALWHPVLAWTLLVTAIFAWAIKAAYWEAVDGDTPMQTLADATGLRGLGTVKPLIPPHTQANFVMREMGYVVARKHARRLRVAAVVLLFVLPMIAGLTQMLLASNGVGLLIASAISVLSASLGILVERWLFFAEARHVAMVYYDGGPA